MLQLRDICTQCVCKVVSYVHMSHCSWRSVGGHVHHIFQSPVFHVWLHFLFHTCSVGGMYMCVSRCV